MGCDEVTTINHLVQRIRTLERSEHGQDPSIRWWVDNVGPLIEAVNKDPDAGVAIGETLEDLDVTLSKLSGFYQVFDPAEWERIKEAILRVLDDYPEVRAAYLAGVGDKNSTGAMRPSP